MQHSVLGIGAAFVDALFFVEDAFLEHFTMEKGSVAAIDLDTVHRLAQKAHVPPLLTPGGSCANVVRALSMLGWQCAITGKIGQDEPGRFLLKNLEEHGIRPHYIPCDLPTGRVLCFITPDAERTMRDLLGASVDMQGEDLSSEQFAERSLVHIEGYTLFNGRLAESAMELAKETGSKVSFDLANFKIVQNHRSELKKMISKHVDILFANAQEAEEMTGLAPEKACTLLGGDCDYAVVTMGAQGCWAAHEGELIHADAIPVEKVVDTTGAGDMFSAGFLDGVFDAASLEESAKRGAFLASHIITVQGAYIPPSRWDEILRALGSINK